MLTSLDDLEKNFHLQKVHFAIQRIQFALESYSNFNSLVRKELDYAVSKLEQNGVMTPTY